MHSRTWYGLNRPWDKYISHTLGKYTLVSYRDCHQTSVDHPQTYQFVVFDNDRRKSVCVEGKNIADLERWCLAHT